MSWYGDEGLRNVTLDPFEIDALTVSVRAFRQFVDATGYRTQAEKAGFAYAVVNGNLKPVNGGSWRNAVKMRAVDDDAPVVGVSFQDALAYCRSKGLRLPTEDEWEYLARGPKRHTFPWGENIGPVSSVAGTAPHVTDGPDEGIGGPAVSGSGWTPKSAGGECSKADLGWNPIRRTSEPPPGVTSYPAEQMKTADSAARNPRPPGLTPNCGWPGAAEGHRLPAAVRRLDST